MICIRITCPLVLYPLTPHVYIVKLGFTGVDIIFSEAVLTCTHDLCFEQKKYITIFHLKTFIFSAVKSYSILHGHVFVMFYNCNKQFS